MNLNREFIKYSGNAEEQAAFTALQETAFKVAEILYTKPDTHAPIAGFYYFIASVGDKIDIFCSSENNFEYPNFDVLSIILVSEIEGLVAEDLDKIRNCMESWILSPKFEISSQVRRDALVAVNYGK